MMKTTEALQAKMTNLLQQPYLANHLRHRLLERMSTIEESLCTQHFVGQWPGALAWKLNKLCVLLGTSRR